MAVPMEEPDARQSAVREYDEESGDAARDMLRLFERAKRFVTDPSVKQLDGADRFRVKEHIRTQLAESIFDDCLLFDERAMCALFGFFSAWRGVAYGHESSVPIVDAGLERAYQRALMTLEPYVRSALAGSSTTSAVSLKKG